MEHLCSEKFSDLAKQWFYWPYIAKEINFYVTKKCKCIISEKPNRNEIAPLAPIESRYRFQMMSVSLLCLDRCKCDFEYIVIVTDHF